jgi:hypothetical protein
MAVSFIGGGNLSIRKKITDLLQVTENFWSIFEMFNGFMVFNATFNNISVIS